MIRRPRQGTPLEVFATFLRLGLTAFGGPVAHIGYFREAFVARRRWIGEAAYADLVALCQFLPGPASSQVGFALGLMRAGPLGGLAAWVGFTLPSALLMTAAANGLAAFSGGAIGGVIHGLKLVAVAVVAQAVLGMTRTLTPDPPRAGVALAAVVLVTAAGGAVGQIAAIMLGAGAGLWVCRAHPVSGGAESAFRLPPRIGVAAAVAYLGLLIGLPVIAAATGSRAIAQFDAFYRSGALVFGGGHVVLPLLKQAVVDPGWVGRDTFLAGYGVAQAMPGPLFTFGAYLGAAIGGLPGAALALAAIFLPGLLALLAALPFWASLRARPTAQAALRGANAAVVGILAAAFYNPVWTSAVLRPADFAIALSGFVLLTAFRAPPILVVLLGVGAGVVEGLPIV